VLRSIKNYQPDGKFKAWLLRIATNIFLDQKKAPRSRDVVNSEVTALAPSKSNDASERAYDAKEIIESLWEAIRKLSKVQQVVVLLRGTEHLEYPEIATILKMKEVTVRWHLHEARRILRHELGKKFDLGSYVDE